MTPPYIDIIDVRTATAAAAATATTTGVGGAKAGRSVGEIANGEDTEEASTAEAATIQGWEIRMYRERIVRLSRAGKWEAAWELLRELTDERGGPGDRFMYQSVLSSVIKHGQDVRIDAGVGVGKNNGYYSIPLAIVQHMVDNGVDLDNTMYTTIIKVFSKKSDQHGWDSSLRLLDVMIKRGLKPPPAAFTSAISACGNTRPLANWRAAERLMHDLRQAGHRPNTRICNALMRTYARAKQWRRAQRLFDSMAIGGDVFSSVDDEDLTQPGEIPLSDPDPDPDPVPVPVAVAGNDDQRLQTRPDAFTYTTLIHAYAGADMPEAALRVLRQMRSNGMDPNVVTLCASIRACCGQRGRFWRQAVEIYSEMQEAGMLDHAGDGDGPGGEALRSIISVMAHTGKWKKALELFRTDPSPSYQTCASMIEAYSRSGMWEPALKLAEEMVSFRGFQLNGLTYRALIRACRKKRRWQTAVALFQQMRANRQTVTEGAIADTLLTFRSARGAWIRALHFIRAFSSSVITSEEQEWEYISPLVSEAKSLLKNGPQARTNMRSVLHALLALCDDQAKWKISLQVHKVLVEETNVSPNAETYERMMVACAKAGEPEQAAKVLSLADRWLGPQMVSSKLHVGVIVAHAQKREWEVALSKLLDLQRNGVHTGVGAYNAVMGAMASAYQWRQAAELLRLMDIAGLQPDYTTYDTLIDVHEQCGQWEKALSIYERMEGHLDAEVFERRSRSKMHRAAAWMGFAVDETEGAPY